MAKFKNTVWDTVASAYVAWLSDDDYDPAGASYPGPGTFGVDTSQYRRGEIYDAVIASATDDTAIHTDVADEFDAVSEKATPVSADKVFLEDSEDTDNKKWAQVGNLPGGGGAHALGSATHTADTLANLNTKVSDATLDDSSDSRPPSGAASGDLSGTYPGPSVAAGAVGNTKLADMAQATIKGRAAGAGTGDPTDLTAAQATAILDEFTDALQGVVPASGGGTANYLRADGTWASPGGGAHALGGATHTADTLANLNTKISDATLDDSSDPRDPNSHGLGGAAHAADTLANLNSKVSDATLDDSSDPRDPNAHALGGSAHSADTLANLNSKVSDATLDDSSDPRDPNAHALGGAAHSADTLANLNAKVSDATLDDITGKRNADRLQGDDIDSAITPTDGQVLTYDGTGTQWVASTPADGVSYLEMGHNHTLTSAGGSPDSDDIGRALFDGGEHSSITFRAILQSVYATTGSSEVKLYDDGSKTTPDTPRLVCTLSAHTDDTLAYEVFEQALTVVSSSPTTNEILDSERVYRAVVEITATSGDTVTVDTVGFAAAAGVGGGGGGVGGAGGEASNLWAHPATPHADDDEFEADTLDASWSAQVLGVGPATISSGTVDAYDATLTGTTIRVQPNPATRRSWLLVQPPDIATTERICFYKPYTFPTNIVIMARMRFSMRRGGLAEDANVGIGMFTDVGGGVPDKQSGIELYLNEPEGGECEAEMRYYSTGGAASGIVTTVNVSYQGQALEYVALHKIGDDVHGWVGTAGGNWIYMTSYNLTTIGFTPDLLCMIFGNSSANAPGQMVHGIDFLRFYETDNFLF